MLHGQRLDEREQEREEQARTSASETPHGDNLRDRYSYESLEAARQMRRHHEGCQQLQQKDPGVQTDPVTQLMCASARAKEASDLRYAYEAFKARLAQEEVERAEYIRNTHARREVEHNSRMNSLCRAVEPRNMDTLTRDEWCRHIFDIQNNNSGGEAL
jgi:hypothetical protein